MEEQLQLPKHVAYFSPIINVIYATQNENAHVFKKKKNTMAYKYIPDRTVLLL